MITEYTTQNGHTLWLGRLDRREIDASAASNPPPTPPTKTVEAWAGPEQVPDWNDSGYQQELGRYYKHLGKSQVAMIAPAVTLPTSIDFGELDELMVAGLARVPGNDPKIGFLLYVLDDDDRGNLVQIILYNSTVTERAIAEAGDMFGVTWMGKPITAWGVPGTPGRYNLEFEARRAARYNLVPWCEFCDLTGLEQSALVCFYRMDGRLEYFQAEWRNRKTK